MKTDIITLPPSRWRENRELRLRALVNAPTAFGRTYEEDAALPDEKWIQWLVDAQNGKTFLLFAEHENKLIGMVGAILGQGEKRQHSATIIAVYVEPQFRGEGVGQQLLRALLEKLSTDPRIVKIDLHVNTQASPAIALYESLGFEKVGVLEKALYHDGIFHDEYIMTKMIK
jgi:ribosomal protein S18 acetylase RimI-like enzyme